MIRNCLRSLKFLSFPHHALAHVKYNKKSRDTVPTVILCGITKTVKAFAKKQHGIYLLQSRQLS